MVIWHGCHWVHRQTMAVLHMHSGFPTKMVEQTIVTSLNDITRISHAIEGGNYKRGAQPSLWSLAAAITVIWVFWYKC